MVTISSSGDAISASDATGMRLFSLQHKSGCYMLLDSKDDAVIRTTTAAGGGAVAFEDKTGRTLTTEKRHAFEWEGARYVWQTGLLELGSGLRLQLRRIDESGEGKKTLAWLKLPTNTKRSQAELLVVAQAPDLPLGIIIFQSLIMEHQWSNLKTALPPLKKLRFASKWL